MKIPTYRILLFLLLLLIAHSLHAQKNNKQDLIIEKRDFSNFTQILAKGVSNVYITQGNTFEVRVEAPQEMIDKIVIAQTGNQLLITTQNTNELVSSNFVSDVKAMRKIAKSKVFLTLPYIEVLEVAASADVYAKNTFKQDHIQLIVSGAGDLKIDLEAQEVICKINGAGDLLLSGRTQNLVAEVSGVGDLKAYNLITKAVQVKASGASDVFVFAVDSLRAEVSGTADLHYRGNPLTTNFSVSGVADIRPNGK